jgi:hypothetical protein
MSARTVLNEAEKHGVKVTLNAAANSNPVQSGRRLDGIGSPRARRFVHGLAGVSRNAQWELQASLSGDILG